jgi:hypothetical protein
MPARFHVKHTFAIENRHLFVLVGRPVEGTLAAGMHASVPVSAALFVSIPIDGVEMVRRGGAESVALTYRYSRPEELATLRDLALGETILEITDAQEEDSVAPEPLGTMVHDILRGRETAR